MVIFKCVKCGCAENSALCRYNTTRWNDEPNLCSECDPKIGKWHNKFPKKPSVAGGTMSELTADKIDEKIMTMIEKAIYHLAGIKQSLIDKKKLDAINKEASLKEKNDI